MKDRKILVDTSAWILSFRKSGHEELKEVLRQAIDLDRVAITPFIVLELLQGCKTQKEFNLLKTRLESLQNCPVENIAWARLYAFSFSLRRKGLTLPTIDLLIAFISIENDTLLLHHDHHFRMIAEHSKLNAIDFLG